MTADVAGRRGRLVGRGIVLLGGAVLIATLADGAAADTRTFTLDLEAIADVASADVDLSDATCDEFRTAATTATDTLAIHHPDLVLPSVIVGAGADNIVATCGDSEWRVDVGGTVTTGTGPADVDATFAWSDAADPTPTVAIAIDVPDGTRLDELNDLGASLLPGFDVLASHLPADVATDSARFDLRLPDDPAGDASLDLVADVAPSAIAGVDVPLRVLAAADRSGGSTETVAALRIGDGASATFPMQQLFPGTDLGLAAGVQLPSATLVYVPAGAGDIDVAAHYADRPLPLDLLGASSGGDPLFGELHGGSGSFGAEFPLDPLGDEVRDFFGYAPGETVRLVGTADVDLGVIAGGSQPVTYASLAMTLPALGDSAFLPDSIRLGATTLGLELDASSLSLTFDSSAEFDLPDPSQDVTLDATFAGSFTVATDGTLSVHFEAAVPGDASDPAWPDILGFDPIDLYSATVTFDLVVPGDPADDITLAARLDGTAAVAGKQFTAEIGVTFAETSLTLDLGFRLESEIALSELTGLFGVDLPDELFDVSVGPNATNSGSPLLISAHLVITDAGDVSGSFAINAPGTFTVLGTPFGVDFLFSLEVVDLDAKEFRVLAGARTSKGTTVGDLAGTFIGSDLADALDTIGLRDLELPPIGFLFTLDELDTPSTDLTAEEAAFFAPLYGCPVDDDTCVYEVRLKAGFHIMSALTIPDTPDTAALGDVLEAFWLSRHSSLLLDAYVEIEDGKLAFEGIGLSLRLPINPTPEVRPDWFRRASIAIDFEVNTSGLRLALGGELGIRMRDDSRVDEAACLDPIAPKHWLVIVPGQPERGCYDLLDFAVSAELSVGTAVQITVSGVLESDGGWRAPLGLEFLNFGGVALQMTVDVTTGTPSFLFGFYVSGALILEPGFEKDITGSFVVGLRTIASPPFVVPDFRGMRLASQAGIELTDLERIYEIAKERAAAVTSGIGGETDNPLLDAIRDLPTVSISDIGVPNVSLRNLELMIGLGNYPSVCISTGVRLGAELYVGAAPGGSVTVETPSSCPDAPIADPIECLAYGTEEGDDRDPCFAAVAMSVGTDGLTLAGSRGALDLGPIHWDDALFELKATPSEQLLRFKGGASIDGLLSGQVDVSIEPAAIDVYGDVVLFPDAAPNGQPAFRALVEGTAGVDIEQVFTDPANIGSIDLHIVLQSDFDALLRTVVGGPLTGLRDSAVVVETLYDELKSNNGDLLAALRRLPARLEALGYDVPDWFANDDPNVLDVVQVLVTIDGLLQDAGLQPPTMGQLFEGVRLPTPIGVPGFWFPSKRECWGAVLPGTVINGTCYAVPPWFLDPDGELGTWVDPVCYALPGVGGVVVGGQCWAFQPITEIPGVLDLLYPGQNLTFQQFLDTRFEPMLAEALQLFGLPPGTSLSDALDSLAGEAAGLSSPVRLDCVEFRFRAGGSAAPAPSVRLTVVGSVFGSPIGLDLGWNFNEPAGDQADELFRALMAALFDGGGPITCSPIGGPPITSSTDGDTGFTPAVTPNSVVEGGEVVLSGVYGNGLTDATAATVTWGDGSTQQTTVGALRAGVAHTYRDDNSSDTMNLTVTIGGVSRSVVVNVANVAPDATASLAAARVSEGAMASLTVAVTDPGIDDTFSVDIVWGDGTTTNRSGVPLDDFPFTLDHLYVDDDPSGTPADPYRIDVRVRDDDGGADQTAATVTVENVAPTGITVVPSAGTVEEGLPVTYEIAWTDLGARDVHTVVVDWGDGVVDRYRSAGSPLLASHLYLDDDPTGTPVDSYDVSVTVTDDDTGVGTAVVPVDVVNVAPLLGATASIDRVDEGPAGTITIDGGIRDQGVLDTHVVTIDWGYDGFADTVLTTGDGIAVIGGGYSQFTASQTYGDDGVFEITVTVADDDTGTVVWQHTLTVDDVDPTTAVDEAGTVVADGPDDDGILATPTFVLRSDETLELRATASDPGSDDLTFDWSFGDGSGDIETYLWGTTPDGAPSPEVGARVDVLDETAHRWPQLCVYQIDLVVTDDDGGSAADRTWAVVTGVESRVFGAGWWSQQYDARRAQRNGLDTVTTGCAIEIVEHLSQVFSTSRSIATAADVRDVLDTSRTSSATELLDQHLLTAWLNVANGSLRFDEVIDVLRSAESVRLDPTASRSQLLAQKARLAALA